MTHYFETGGFFETGSWHSKEDEAWAAGIFVENTAKGETTIWEKMQQANMDYLVHKLPASYLLPDGSHFLDGGRWGLVREKTAWGEPERLRVVGSRYDVIQNVDIARVLDPIARNWTLEGLGVLKGGRIVFVELRLDPFDVGGHEREKCRVYLLVANDHTKGSLIFGQSLTRVVCNNTFNAALANNKELDFIPHTSNPQAEMEFRSRVVEITIKHRKAMQETLNALFVRPVSKKEVATVIEAAFPNPKKSRNLKVAEEFTDMQGEQDDVVVGFFNKAEDQRRLYELQTERIKELRLETGMELARFNDEQPYAGNTAYALFNAVTAVTNHSSSFSGGADKNMVSLFFGQKAEMNRRAWEAVTELVK